MDVLVAPRRRVVPLGMGHRKGPDPMRVARAVGGHTALR